MQGQLAIHIYRGEEGDGVELYAFMTLCPLYDLFVNVQYSV
jgi:hypothetical protein